MAPPLLTKKSLLTCSKKNYNLFPNWVGARHCSLVRLHDVMLLTLQIEVRI
jgi:hypothetical protein